MTSSLTSKQIGMARHALGLPNPQNMTYRNHYCIGKGGAEYEAWEDLVRQGLAVKAPGEGKGWVGDFFYLTLAGARAVLKPQEHISREDSQAMWERES